MGTAGIHHKNGVGIFFTQLAHTPHKVHIAAGGAVRRGGKFLT